MNLSIHLPDGTLLASIHLPAKGVTYTLNPGVSTRSATAERTRRYREKRKAQDSSIVSPTSENTPLENS